MILVAVGNDEAPQLLAVLEKVRDIGDDQVHPKHLFLWEHEAGVDGDDVVAALEQHHVLADLAEAAEGDNADFVLHGQLALQKAHLLRFRSHRLSRLPSRLF